MLSRQQKNEICNLYKLNHRVNDIALIFDINRRTIYHILKQYNIKSRTATLGENIKKDIIQIYISGFSACDLSKKYEVNVKTIHNILKEYNIYYRHGTRKYFFNERFFADFTPESCYWAGFIAADGNISKTSLSINLQQGDKSHLKKFLQVIGGEQDVKNKPKNIVGVTVCSKKMVTDLKENFNILPNKSLVIRMPSSLPKDMIRHYVRGYFDGDGTIYYGKRLKLSFSIVSGSPGQINDLKDAIKLCLNIQCSVKTYDGRRYTIRKSCSGAKKIFEWFYEDICSGIVLARKIEKFNNFLKAKEHHIENKTRKRIFSVRNNKILELKNNDTPVREIARMFNMSESGCYHVLSLMK